MDRDPTDALPPGVDYFDVVFKLEAECEATTTAYLPKAGTKAPTTWARLGANLAALDALSSCCGDAMEAITLSSICWVAP